MILKLGRLLNLNVIQIAIKRMSMQNLNSLMLCVMLLLSIYRRKKQNLIPPKFLISVVMKRSIMKKILQYKP